MLDFFVAKFKFSDIIDFSTFLSKDGFKIIRNHNFHTTVKTPNIRRHFRVRHGTYAQTLSSRISDTFGSAPRIWAFLWQTENDAFLVLVDYLLAMHVRDCQT